MATDREWFENQEFWNVFAPLMFDEQRWAGSRWEAESLCELVGIAPASKILDSCCGVGRHSVAFRLLGHQVTGIDITQSYIEAAKESAQAMDLDIEFLCSDVRSFIRPGAYNLATNLFTSFGFFSDPEDEKKYIQNIRRSLTKGGSFVIDVKGKELMGRDFIDGESWEHEGKRVRTEYTILDSWNILQNRWIIEDENGIHDYTFSHRLYSALELEQLLRQCGFVKTESYGSFDGKQYDDKAERLIVIGRT